MTGLQTLMRKIFIIYDERGMRSLMQSAYSRVRYLWAQRKKLALENPLVRRVVVWSWSFRNKKRFNQKSSSSRNLKILYVDTLSAPNAQTNIAGLQKAYEKVGTVEPFDYRLIAASWGEEIMNELLVHTATLFRPDLVHLGKSESVNGQAIRRIKERIDTCIIHFYGDFRWEPRSWIVDIGQYADYTLVQYKDVTEIKKLQDLGISPIGFWWQGIDPEIMLPKDIPKTKSVIFMANNSNFLQGHQERRDLIEAIIELDIDLHLYGVGWEYLADRSQVYLHPLVQGEDFARACSTAKVSLGLGSVSNVYFYNSWPRMFNSMASGAFHLTKYFPGLETIFQNRKHLVWYHSIPEAVELINYYLVHTEEREEIAQAGRQKVLANHTWDHRVDEMLRYFKQYQQQNLTPYMLDYLQE